MPLSSPLSRLVRLAAMGFMALAAVSSLVFVIRWQVPLLFLLPMLVVICTGLGVALWWSERRADRLGRAELRAWIRRRGV